MAKIQIHSQSTGFFKKPTDRLIVEQDRSVKEWQAVWKDNLRRGIIENDDETLTIRAVDVPVPWISF